ncbi:MAG: DUF488 domain-containing protein [Nostoc sp.]|uniref:DUF488 domain-containing protein n=1 Tax=Nostoc sp. TaxID=1180 RepID=UPI002FFB7778
MNYKAGNIEPLILTFGYGNRKNYDEFLKYVEMFHVNYVVDVRSSPRAWSRKWYGTAIDKLCNSINVKYISQTALGNTSGNKNWIPPNQEEARLALLEIAQIGQNETILLLCAELQSAKCHRVSVANQLHELTGIAVKHLE